jgi:FtsP/CotA-like multicopper oxidase with cupredoxin domain
MSQRTPSGLTAGVLQVVDLEAAERDWEISPGMVVRGYAFNGQAPGPVIEARVGDTLLVQFTNLLPEPATIRWPGLPEPAARNGSELAADPVPPGGHLRYQLHLPNAGTFWYHSANAATTQTNRGLCGVLVVRELEEQVFDGERVLLIHDLELNRRGELGALAPLLEDRHEPPEGEVLLVNGALEPEMQIATGQVERWRLVNTTNARHLRLSLGGHPFHLIRTNGPAHHAVDELHMNPGDRFDLAVGPFPGGETVLLEALPYDRRPGEPPHRRLATLHVNPPETPSSAAGENIGGLTQPGAHGVARSERISISQATGWIIFKSQSLDPEEGFA